jgi:hypothetical protein
MSKVQCSEDLNHTQTVQAAAEVLQQWMEVKVEGSKLEA